MAAKTTCPITRKQFEDNARPIKVVINGEEMLASNKQFSTGSMGWNISSKMKVKVGDQEVDRPGRPQSDHRRLKGIARPTHAAFSEPAGRESDA